MDHQTDIKMRNSTMTWNDVYSLLVSNTNHSLHPSQYLYRKSHMSGYLWATEWQKGEETVSTTTSYKQPLAWTEREVGTKPHPKLRSYWQQIASCWEIESGCGSWKVGQTPVVGHISKSIWAAQTGKEKKRPKIEWVGKGQLVSMIKIHYTKYTKN